MINNVGTQKIKTQRLILRRFEISDTMSVFKNWASDEEVQSLYSEPAYETVEQTQNLLNKYISYYENKNYYRWAIILKKSHSDDRNQNVEEACIGQIAYFLVDEKNHFAEIEYCIGKNYWKNGYATEATKAVISFGFEKMNLHKVQICHKAENIRSKRVIEKCGLTYEGTLRDFFFSDGRYINRLYYSILKDEYAEKY